MSVLSPSGQERARSIEKGLAHQVRDDFESTRGERRRIIGESKVPVLKDKAADQELGEVVDEETLSILAAKRMLIKPKSQDWQPYHSGHEDGDY